MTLYIDHYPPGILSCKSCRTTAMIKTAAVLLLVALLGPSATQGVCISTLKKINNFYLDFRKMFWPLRTVRAASVSVSAPHQATTNASVTVSAHDPGQAVALASPKCAPLPMEPVPRPTCLSALKTFCLPAELMCLQWRTG